MIPNPSLDPVNRALTAFITRFWEASPQEKQSFPPITADADWMSECQFCKEDLTLWRPVEQKVPVNFAGLEHALEISVHPDIKAYYGSFWSASFEADTDEGHVSLIQLWNQQDFSRLIENLIGHSMMKKKRKQPLTVFVANTEADSEYFLSIDNATGALLLENPAKGIVKQVDTCVADFLNRLTPDLKPPLTY